jgi:S-DNA-T family DNA segregation ATPase FtsK/SpoIIIE
MPVDQPDSAAPLGSVPRGERRPIVPGWARTLRGVRDHVRRHVTHWAHVAAFHALRAPLYALRSLARMPRGVWRAVREVTAWAADLEGRPIRKEAQALQRHLRSPDGRPAARGRGHGVAAAATPR